MIPLPADWSARLELNQAAHAARWGFGVTLPPSLPDDIRLELDAPDGRPPAASVRSRGAWRAIHSRRRPDEEALRWLDSALADTRSAPAVVCIIGAGLGYVVDAAAARLPDAKVLVVEPQAGLTGWMLGRRDWRELIETGRLMVLSGPEYAGRVNAWKIFGDTPALDPLCLAHPVLAAADPDAARAAATLVAHARRDALANERARLTFAPTYLLNTLANLDRIVEGGDAGALRGTFAKVPGIVVAAGPSLDASLPAMRKLAGRAVIVAVDTALAPLYSHGIVPHFTVAVDPGRANAAHFAGVTASDRTWLVAEGSVDPETYPAFGSRVFTYRVAEHHPWPWLIAHGVERAKLRAWGSVLVTAVDFAIAVGLDPLVLVGADLAYTGGRPYCRGTAFERPWSEQVARGDTLDEIWGRHLPVDGTHVRGVDGRQTLTSPMFVSVASALVEYLQEADDRGIVNASAGGILLGGRLRRGALDAVGRDWMALPDDVPDRIVAAWHGGRGSQAAAPALDRTTLRRLLAPAAHDESAWIAATNGKLTPQQIAAALAMAERRTRTAPRSIAAPATPALDTAAPHVLRTQRYLAHAFATWAVEPPDWTAAALPPSALIPERILSLKALTCDAVTKPAASPVQTPGASSEAFTALMTAPVIVRGLLPAPAFLAQSMSTRVPATAWFDWTPLARPAIDRIERDARRPQGGPGEVAESADAAPLYRRGFDRVRCPLHDDGVDAQLLARLSALHAWAATQGCADSPPLAEKPLGACSPATAVAWFAALATASGERSQDPEIAVTLVARPRPGEMSAALRTRAPLSSIVRALTGTIVEEHESSGVRGDSDSACARSLYDWEPQDSSTRISVAVRRLMDTEPTSGDPRARFLASGARTLRFEHRADLGRCWFASPWDPVVTPVEGNCSYALEAEGRARPLHAWPENIMAEVPWGDGGRLAWHLRRRRILWRPSNDDPVFAMDVPFRPSRVIAGPDGRPYWAAADGGLWRALPEHGCEKIADAPPSFGIAHAAEGLRLDPFFRNMAGGVERRRDGEAYVWHAQERRAYHVPLTDLGPCWATSVADNWEAAAYPNADIVRIRSLESARCFWLACSRPCAVTWAGGSLVVVTLGRDVLLFRKLAGELD